MCAFVTSFCDLAASIKSSRSHPLSQQRLRPYHPKAGTCPTTIVLLSVDSNIHHDHLHRKHYEPESAGSLASDSPPPLLSSLERPSERPADRKKQRQANNRAAAAAAALSTHPT